MEFEPTMLAPESKPSESKKSPESGPTAESKEKKGLPEGYVAEKKRRESIKREAAAVAELEQEFALLSSGNLEKHLETIDARETLISGAERSREAVGEAGVNAITRRRFEGDPERIAYVKPQSGEASFRYDAATNQVLKVNRSFNEKTQQMETSEEVYAEGASADPSEQNLVNHFKLLAEGQPELRAQIAEAYGISPEDVPLSKTEFSPRMGVDAGKSAIREYTTSQIDNLLNFGVVPQTVLRAEKGKTGSSIEMNSVQEAFTAKNPDVPVRTVDPALFAELQSQGKDHPGAKSFMRIACMHWLRKALDGHNDNILYDPTTKEFNAIDNGLSQGLSRVVEKQDPATGETKKTVEPLDPLRSIPLEIIQEHDDWELDEDALKEIKRIYDSTVEYLKFREEFTKKQKAREAAVSSFDADTLNEEALENMQRTQGGREIKYVTKLFRLQYENERIAEKEGVEFFKNLKYLLDHKRPPKLKVGDQGGELFPLAAMLNLKTPDRAKAA